MASNISFNPYLTSNAQNTFSIKSDGYVQGVALDDPAIRNTLSSGQLATTETLPMWGGVLISESIPGVAPADSLGSIITSATSIANATGIVVNNQAHHWITTPQSECPAAAAGMTVHFYRFKSGARIPLAVDPALVSLDGGLISQQVSWDFGSRRVVQYAAAYAANVFTAMSSSYTSGNGYATVTGTTTSAHGLVPGNTITVSGATPAAYNGSFVLISGTTGSTIVYQVPGVTAALGTVTTQGQINAGGGVLPISVLRVDIGNSKTVTYDAVNNYVHYNNTGSVVLALI